MIPDSILKRGRPEWGLELHFNAEGVGIPRTEAVDNWDREVLTYDMTHYYIYQCARRQISIVARWKKDAGWVEENV